MQKDIIERAIEQFVAGIAYVMKMRQQQQEEKASEFIKEELLKRTGLYPENILSLPENLTKEIISRKSRGEPEYRIYIADLITQQAEIYVEKKMITEGIKLLKMALGILSETETGKNPAKDKKIQKKIKYIKQMIS